MSEPTEQDFILDDYNEAETALDAARAECSHLPARMFFESMAELIGQMVRDKELTADEVLGFMRDVLPPEPPMEDIPWHDL